MSCLTWLQHGREGRGKCHTETWRMAILKHRAKVHSKIRRVRRLFFLKLSPRRTATFKQLIYEGFFLFRKCGSCYKNEMVYFWRMYIACCSFYLNENEKFPNWHIHLFNVKYIRVSQKSASCRAYAACCTLSHRRLSAYMSSDQTSSVCIFPARRDAVMSLRRAGVDKGNAVTHASISALLFLHRESVPSRRAIRG